MLDNTYKEFQEISYEDFYDLFWMEVSEKIVSGAYLDEHRDFVDTLTYDYWRLFEMNDNTSIRIMARAAEAFFYSMFRYKPLRENIKQIQD